MRTLRNYILEGLLSEELNENTVTLQNLQIPYNGPSNLYVQCPKTYNESDLQIYLEDTLLSKFPCGSDCECNDLFGDNIRNVNDVNFSWDKCDLVENSSTYDIEWVKDYDKSVEEEDLGTIYISNIKYNLTFSQFILSGVTDETYEDKLNDIVDSSTSDNYEYPFKISVNTSDLLYRKV